jgi:hypothetical protein
LPAARFLSELWPAFSGAWRTAGDTNDRRDFHSAALTAGLPMAAFTRGITGSAKSCIALVNAKYWNWPLSAKLYPLYPQAAGTPFRNQPAKD